MTSKLGSWKENPNINQYLGYFEPSLEIEHGWNKMVPIKVKFPKRRATKPCTVLVGRISKQGHLCNGNTNEEPSSPKL